jgi:hypothetical protein
MHQDVAKDQIRNISSVQNHAQFILYLLFIFAISAISGLPLKDSGPASRIEISYLVVTCDAAKKRKMLMICVNLTYRDTDRVLSAITIASGLWSLPFLEEFDAHLQSRARPGAMRPHEPARFRARSHWPQILCARFSTSWPTIKPAPYLVKEAVCTYELCISVEAQVLYITTARRRLYRISIRKNQ